MTVLSSRQILDAIDRVLAEVSRRFAEDAAGRSAAGGRSDLDARGNREAFLRYLDNNAGDEPPGDGDMVREKNERARDS